MDNTTKPPEENAINNAAISIPIHMRWQRFLRDSALMYIVFALVGNSMLAQLFYNSAGVLLPNSDWRSRYLIVSAIFSTIAFSLFEISQVSSINEMMSNGVTYSRSDWRKKIFALVIVSGYNFYVMALFNYQIWPTGSVHPHNGMPSPKDIALEDWIHALFYSAILMLAGLVGEKKRSAEEQVVTIEDEIQKALLQNARDEAAAMIDGKMGSGRAITAMMVLGPEKSKRFFANFKGAMDGSITSDDVIASGDIEGVIVPRITPNIPAISAILDDSVIHIVRSNRERDAERGSASTYSGGEEAEESEESLEASGTHSRDGDKIESSVKGDGSKRERGVKGDADQPQNLTDYTPLSNPLSAYCLPDGKALTERKTSSEMADLIGCPRGSLSGLLRRAESEGMQFEGPDEGQPSNTKNIYLWQVVAMIDMGWEFTSNIERIAA